MPASVAYYIESNYIIKKLIKMVEVERLLSLEHIKHIVIRHISHQNDWHNLNGGKTQYFFILINKRL